MGATDFEYSRLVFMVEEFIIKTKLSKIGFKFDDKELTDFDIACFMVISNKFKELEIAELKRKENLDEQHNPKSSN